MSYESKGIVELGCFSPYCDLDTFRHYVWNDSSNCWKPWTIVKMTDVYNAYVVSDGDLDLGISR